MTKEQFIQEMLEWVLYYKEKLDTINLRQAMLPKEISGETSKITYNPFIEFAPKYFNTKLLSNLQALNSVICSNPDVNVHQIKLFVISNMEFKVLNQVLNYNPYTVEELKDKIHGPMDIAVAYARHCEAQDKYQNLPKR